MKLLNPTFLYSIEGNSVPSLDKYRKIVIFAGRSNVGKSTFINCLVGRKRLAYVSKKPGRTRKINLFEVGDNILFADLPGYGYAKVSKEEKKRWNSNIVSFINCVKGKNCLVVLLVDAKIAPTPLDIEALHFFKEHKLDTLVVANKVDKVRKSELKKRLSEIAYALEVEEVFPFSAHSKGRWDIVYRITE